MYVIFPLIGERLCLMCVSSSSSRKQLLPDQISNICYSKYLLTMKWQCCAEISMKLCNLPPTFFCLWTDLVFLIFFIPTSQPPQTTTRYIYLIYQSWKVGRSLQSPVSVSAQCWNEKFEGQDRKDTQSLEDYCLEMSRRWDGNYDQVLILWQTSVTSVTQAFISNKKDVKAIYRNNNIWKETN